MITQLETKSRELAERLHEGQYRKGGNTPYIEHPRQVVRLLKEIGVRDENIICAAWLHDTIEDCGIDADYLRKEYNPEIARIVACLTRDVGRDEYLNRIRNADYPVQIIKLADVVHNSASLYPGIEQKTIDRIATDSRRLYLGLAQKIAPEFCDRIIDNLKPYAARG